MSLLSKENIIAADDIAYEYVDVPEWGGKVKIYAMSLAQHIEYEKLSTKGKDNPINGEQIVFVLSQALRNEDGSRLFTEEEAKLLLNKNTRVVSRLFAKCAELSKFSDTDIKGEEKN